MSLIAIKFVGIGATIKLISGILENTDRPNLARIVRVAGIVVIVVLASMSAAEYISYVKLLHYHKATWYLV